MCIDRLNANKFMAAKAETKPLQCYKDCGNVKNKQSKNVNNGARCPSVLLAYIVSL